MVRRALISTAFAISLLSGAANAQVTIDMGCVYMRPISSNVAVNVS